MNLNDFIGGPIVCQHCGRAYNCARDIHICSHGESGKISQTWFNERSASPQPAEGPPVGWLMDQCCSKGRFGEPHDCDKSQPPVSPQDDSNVINVPAIGEQFKFTDAEREQINALDNYSGTDTNDRLFPLIEQVVGPRWDALAREVTRLRALIASRKA